MKAHFFDIDVILNINSLVWIVDKTIPNIPIIKISKSDFKLIKNGIYKNQGNSINFGDDTYWLPNDIYQNLKIKTKVNKANISNLAFSMQEFMNKDLIEKSVYEINIDNILHIKNTDDDIYIICSRNNKKNYEIIISKIEDKLRENGLTIKNYYYISETFYNRNSDDISYKKVRLLLQHLIGLKTDDNKFINEEIKSYNEIYYYDNEQSSINLAKNSNNVLEVLLSNTESYLKNIIKDYLKEEKTIFVNLVTSNKINKFITDIIKIKFSNLIKAFECFKYKR